MRSQAELLVETKILGIKAIYIIATKHMFVVDVHFVLIAVCFVWTGCFHVYIICMYCSRV